MTTWTEYKSGQKVSSVTDGIGKTIIKELGENLLDFFSFKNKARPQQTRLIKDKLSLLGRDKFKYKVYANGLSPHLTQINGGGFKNTEWLFDLH
jgi:hypothetical protein